MWAGRHAVSHCAASQLVQLTTKLQLTATSPLRNSLRSSRVLRSLSVIRSTAINFDDRYGYERKKTLGDVSMQLLQAADIYSIVRCPAHARELTPIE